MEKATERAGNPLIRVALTGAESTGKSTLAAGLARHFKALYIPEYARDYVAGLGRPYTYCDVEHIACTQVRQLKEYSAKAGWILFLDTYLIITKVWFDEVFHRRPDWLTRVAAREIDLYLLCDTDIPWEADRVRENGGERREELYRLYRKELELAGCHFEVVTGLGEDRLRNAVKLTEKYLKTHGYGGAEI